MTTGIDTRQAKALAHPLRQALLIKLNEKVASPRELAQELGERLENVSYHVRVLADLGCIELVKTTPRRNTLEHHYRAMMRPFFNEGDLAAIPLSTRRVLFDGVLGEIWKDISRAAKGGGFDEPDVHVSRTTLSLDEQGRSEVAALLADALDRAMVIHAESAGRMVKGDVARDSSSTTLALFHFDNPQKDSGAP